MSAKFRTLKLMMASTMLVAPMAFAQESVDDEARQETIVVTATPIRDSQIAAIEAKRNADNVVDVLAADTIGRFPDQNLADSLGRVPGLAIERDQGQARFINFRGAPFRYTKIAFDGVDVLGAEDGRTPRFDAFPSVITSRIEVNKAITADMPGEATVGFVNIETFKPFDREGFSFTGEAGYGKQELGDVDINKYNGRISYSNDTFGALLFASHNLRGRITDNREYSYVDTNDDGVDDAVSELDFRSYMGEREDNAYGGRVEVRPNDYHTFFVSSLYSEFIDREERNQFVFSFFNAVRDENGEVVIPVVHPALGPIPAAIPAPVALGTSAYVSDISVSRLLEDGVYENSTYTNTLGYDGKLGEWDVEARLNHTETERTESLPIPYSTCFLYLAIDGSCAANSNNIGGTVDVTDIFNPRITLTQANQPGTTVDVNTLDYGSTFGVIFAGRTETEATKFKLDLERELDVLGNSTTVKFGGQYDTREADGGSALSFGGFPSSVDINQYVTGLLWYSDFDNSIGGRIVDNSGLHNAWRDAAGGLNAPFDDDSLIKIEEDILALYAMGTSEFSWGNIVYGLRAEMTEFTTSGTLAGPEGNQAVSVENDFTNLLPSIHANFDVMENMKLRVSASSGVSRPNYAEIRASQGVDPIDLEIDGGNPFLDLEESFGVDAAFEWYFAPASLFSVGAYYRTIDNVIYPGSSTVDGSIYAPGLIAPGTDTTFNSFFNGEDGELSGFELNLIASGADVLPGPLDGLGVSGNITFVDSEFYAPNITQADGSIGGTYSLPGTSDTVYNASIYYEKFGLSARVNYQYRDAWLSTTENDDLTEFWDETKRLDASLRYTIPADVFGAGVTLALNGNNLTDEKDTRYINTPATPNQYEGFGRRWVFSVRVDY